MVNDDVLAYGPWHQWRAWRPVATWDQGWVWGPTIWRRRAFVNLGSHSPYRYWCYVKERP